MSVGFNGLAQFGRKFVDQTDNAAIIDGAIKFYNLDTVAAGGNSSRVCIRADIG